MRSPFGPSDRPPRPPANTRPIRPEDVSGTVVVNVRDGKTEVLQAPDVAEFTAGTLLVLVGEGVGTVGAHDGRTYLIVGTRYPMSRTGRVAYELEGDPRDAMSLGGVNAKVRGRRVA